MKLDRHLFNLLREARLKVEDTPDKGRQGGRHLCLCDRNYHPKVSAPLLQHTDEHHDVGPRVRKENDIICEVKKTE